MDLQLLALIVLAILCVLQWRHSASRMQEMERKIAELAEVKDDLQRLLAKQGQQTASAPETAAPQPAQEEDAPKEAPVPTHAVAAHQSVVPVGQRQPEQPGQKAGFPARGGQIPRQGAGVRRIKPKAAGRGQRPGE